MKTGRYSIALGSAAALCVIALIAGHTNNLAAAPSTRTAATTTAPAPDYSRSSNWLSKPSASESAAASSSICLISAGLVPGPTNSAAR